MSHSAEPRRSARSVRQRVAAAALAIVFGLLGALVPAMSASASGLVTVKVVDQAGDPVVGIPLDFRNFSDNSPAAPLAYSDGTGTVSLTLPDGEYFYYVIDHTVVGVDPYGGSSGGVVVGGSDQVLPDLVVNRYVEVTGQIYPWTSAMGTAGVEVQLIAYSSSGDFWGGTSFSDVTYDGEFSFDALIFDQPYTLSFSMYEDNTPYLDAYLGGELDDPADATRLDGEPGVGFSGLTMSMPTAALITGTVTNVDGDPIEDIWISAEDDPAYDEFFETQTDEFGDYSLYVRPGLTYVVYADDFEDNIYASMAYDGWDGCGCQFDPVTPPSTGIDFELVEQDTELVVVGAVVDDLDTGSPVPDLEVRLYRKVGSAWVLDDVVQTDDGTAIGAYALNFLIYLTDPDEYRIQVANASGRVLQILDGGTTDQFFGSPLYFDPVPTCFGDLGAVTAIKLAFVEVDLATAVGTCAALDSTPTTPGGGGGSGSPKPRIKSGGSSAVATPTATPTPAPSSTASPRPTASPTPAATAAPDVPPASGPDLWWLLWVAIGILVIAIVGGVVYFVRRA